MKTRFEIPLRIPLAVQTATLVRKAIETKVWEEYLPGERRLCEIFQVSRPTILAAVHLLAKDGVLEIQQRRRCRLLAGGLKSPPAPKRLVCFVTHEPVSRFALTVNLSISEMRMHLAKNGFATEILVCPSRTTRVQLRRLDAFLRQNRVVCCVLMSVSRNYQRWFAAQSTPVLLLGSCAVSVELPSLELDHRSVCRHAAGIFLGNGHRQIALVVPDSGMAGELASERGFCEAVKSDRYGNACAVIVRHNGTARSIKVQLDALFRSARPPTAIFVAKWPCVFGVLVYLLRNGIKVPDTVSFIARDNDQSFETVIPGIAHYAFDEKTFARRAVRLVFQMITQGHLSRSPHLVFPGFIDGGTVDRLR